MARPIFPSFIFQIWGHERGRFLIIKANISWNISLPECSKVRPNLKKMNAGKMMARPIFPSFIFQIWGHERGRFLIIKAKISWNISLP